MNEITCPHCHRTMPKPVKPKVTKLRKYECRSAKIGYGCGNIVTVEVVVRAGSRLSALKFEPSTVEYYCKECFDIKVEKGHEILFHREVDTSNFQQCVKCDNFDDEYREDGEMSYSHGKCKIGDPLMNSEEYNPIFCTDHVEKET